MAVSQHISPSVSSLSLAGFRLKKYAHLAQVLFHFGGSPLGVWRNTLITPDSPLGDCIVVCISPEGNICGYFLHAMSNSRSLSGADALFYIQLSVSADEYVSVVLVPFSKICAIRLVHDRENKALSLHMDNWDDSTMVYAKIDPVIQSKGDFTFPEGLYTGMYGSHGAEFVTVHYVEKDVEDKFLLQNPLPPMLKHSVPRLEGIKATGDPNVYAGKRTWVASLHSEDRLEASVVDAIFNDPRPVVAFTYKSEARLYDINSLRSDVLFVAKCFGQINSTAGVWNPSWVTATLIIHKPGTSTLAKGHTPFPSQMVSILWDDIGESSRHLIEYLPYHQRLIDRYGVWDWPS